MEKKALVYFQSGGPSPVINCSFYGVYLEALKHPEIGGIYGSLHGVEGLINGDLIDLRQEDPEEMKFLLQTPGAALGSTRTKLPKQGDPLFDSIVNTVKKHNIGYILVNGGNDSMDTCDKLSRFFKESSYPVEILGIPKTIDNDLAITDHSLGYPSAAKHIINSVKMMAVDNGAYRKGKVLIAEIMGRNAGWLTASTDLLEGEDRPDLIYLPETHWNEEQFLNSVKEIYEKKGHALIALSEGVHAERPDFEGKDAFGHVVLEGVGELLAYNIHAKLGYGTRTTALSIPQRANPLLASQVDRDEAIACSEFAVKEVIKGCNGEMVCIKRLSSSPYKIEFFLSDVSKIANVEKTIPLSWIKDDEGLTGEFKEYLKPLILGEPSAVYENGIFRTARLKKIKVE